MRFGLAYVVGGEELSIEIGDLNDIVIDKFKASDSYLDQDLAEIASQAASPNANFSASAAIL